MGVGGLEPDARHYNGPKAIGPHDRIEGFDCGKRPLDDWLKVHALDNEGRASRTYVVTAGADPQASEVVAYYTLATGAVALKEVHRKLRQNLPNPIPVMVLGRLAVDRRHGGVGLGAGMLKEALQRTADISRSAGVRMLVVHAIDDEAVMFYARYGFRIFPAGTRTMHLPVETILASL